jgi:hypothetical protein
MTCSKNLILLLVVVIITIYLSNEPNNAFSPILSSDHVSDPIRFFFLLFQTTKTMDGKLKLSRSE